MTSREKRMVLFLTILGLAGVAFAVHSLVLQPVQDYRKRYAELEVELDQKQAKVSAIVKQRKRIQEMKTRSLPANVDDAKREYAAAIDRLLRNAGVPVGATIVPKENTDIRNIPKLDAKQPAYTRVGYEIRMKKVDVPTIAKFMEGYYALHLLQQISYFEIKRSDEAIAASRRSSLSSITERADLDVTLVTEAIILDGAENRRSLISVPLSTAAVAGGAGYHMVTNAPAVTRGMKPLIFSPLFSTAKRDYSLLAAKDLFHGPLPEPKKPDPPKTVVVEALPPKPPEEDISPFIKLIDITRHSDGSSESHIFDIANNHDYQINLKPLAERPEVKVQKWFFVDGAAKRADIIENERSINYLAIQEEGTSTNRSFKVMGVADGDGLVLVETVTIAPKESSPKAGEITKDDRRPVFGKGTRPSAKPEEKIKLSGPDAARQATLGGTAAYTPPAKPKTEERVYLWKVGQTLKSLVPLPAEQGRALLERTAPWAVAEAANPPLLSQND